MFIFPDERTLRQFWPHASDVIIAGTLKAAPAVAKRYGHSTILRAAHFWGQITWECDGGSELRESGYYSKEGILHTFGVGRHSAAIGEAEAANLAILCRTDGGRTLFNRTYGAGNPHMAHILGNMLPDGTIPPDAGWNYRGAGALNTTGLEAFIRVGKAIGQDVAGNPDLANDPEIALWMGAEEYAELKCQPLADADDTHAETLKINGGTNGMAARIALISRWKAALQVMAPPIDQSSVIVATSVGKFPNTPAVVPLVTRDPIDVAVSPPSAADRLVPPPSTQSRAGWLAALLASIVATVSAFHLPSPSFDLSSLKEPHMSPFYVGLGLILLVILMVLIADRVIRYKVTPGRNFLSAFENDVFTAASYGLMKVGVFLGLVKAWLEAYFPLFSDSDFLTVVHNWWPGQEINAVVAGIGVFIKVLTIGKTLPLPTFNAIAPASIAAATEAIATAKPVVEMSAAASPKPVVVDPVTGTEPVAMGG